MQRGPRLVAIFVWSAVLLSVVPGNSGGLGGSVHFLDFTALCLVRAFALVSTCLAGNGEPGHYRA
jgi:hypothetical protein